MFLMCLKIFLGRVSDVTIGTIRTVVTIKGKHFIAALLAFFEVLIWYYIAREALNTDINSILVPISYALGYATGTYLGSIISKEFIRGNTSIQVITSSLDLNKIREAGYAVTSIDVTDGFDNKNKKLLLLEIKNKDKKDLTKLIKSMDPNAFITYKETQMVYNGFLK